MTPKCLAIREYSGFPQINSTNFTSLGVFCVISHVVLFLCSCTLSYFENIDYHDLYHSTLSVLNFAVISHESAQTVPNNL